MNFYELAAVVFVIAMFLKFLVGALNIPYEMDAVAELTVCVGVAFGFGTADDALSGGEIMLAASVAFVAMTAWAALQLWRMKQLFAITKGVGRGQAAR